MPKRGLSTPLVVVAVLVLIGIVVWQTKQVNGDDTFRVGVVLPLTGRLSVIGTGEQQGIQLALDSIRSKYPNKKIEVIFEDFASDTKNAVTAANKLLTVDKVKAIITSTTAAAEAVTPIVASAHSIHFVITPDIEIVKRSQYNFRIYYNYVAEAAVLDNFLLHKKAKNISVLGMNYSAIVRQVEEQIKPFLTANNIPLISEEYFDPKEKDFRTNIAKVKNTRPRFLFVSPHVDQVQGITRQLEEAGLTGKETPTIIGAYTFNWSPKEFVNSLEGYHILTPKFQVADTTNAFTTVFKERFSTVPTFDMMYAYDNFSILAKLLIESNGDVVHFTKLFDSLGVLHGASGSIEFVGNRETKVEVVMTRVSMGKQTVVE